MILGEHDHRDRQLADVCYGLIGIAGDGGCLPLIERIGNFLQHIERMNVDDIADGVQIEQTERKLRILR